MKKLILLGFVLALLAGCAVSTPYGTQVYLPVPTVAVQPYYYYPGYYDGYTYYGAPYGW